MLIKQVIIFLLFSAIAISANNNAPEYQVVQTTDGLVRGKIATTIIENREFYEFKGIPFAKPPVGNLRFKVSFESHYHTEIVDIKMRFNYL